LEGQIELTRPDVVLQQSAQDTPESRATGIPGPQPTAGDDEASEWLGAGGSGQDFVAPVRVLLVDESQFAETLRALGEQDSVVRAVLPRWAAAEEIMAAVTATAAGLLVLHPAVIESVGSGSRTLKPGLPDLSASPAQALSPRETEVLHMLADGLGNKEIAWRLHISEHTVKFHIGSIFNKLNASSRAEAVAIAIRRGLIAL